MTATRLILLRHGETEWNREGRYQGHLDSLLTAAGVAQAQALASRLQRQRFSALYSSDLGRAQHTAKIIAERTGHAVRCEERLRERSLGIFQGLLKTEIKQKFPEEYQRFKTAGPDYALPGGESPSQRDRIALAALEDLVRRHPGEQIAIVTHGGVLSGMLRHALGIPPGAPRRFARPNGSWNVFGCENGRWFVETWGDIGHLEQG